MSGAQARSTSSWTIVGAALLATVVGAALLGIFWTPFDPAAVDPAVRLQPPSARHWFGTDQYGRDVFSRVLSGGALSVFIAFAATLIALVAGTLVGGFSAYVGGWPDRLTTLLVDATMAFPALLLSLTLMVALSPGVTSVVLALGIAFSPTVVRVARSTVLSLRSREYVEASVLLGAGPAQVYLRHVLPNCITPLTVLGSSIFALALLTESALSFLGAGVPPPHSTWGGMLAEGRQFLSTAGWLGWIPGVAICVTLLAANLLGDALRDRLDPRMQAGA